MKKHSRNGVVYAIHDDLHGLLENIQKAKEDNSSHSLETYSGHTVWYTEPTQFIQSSAMCYDKGKTFAAHKHKVRDRVSSKTQEVMICVNGAMRYVLYDNNGKYLDYGVLIRGDILTILDGYHDYEVVEDNTVVYEVKNGPFTSVKDDKEYLNVTNSTV